MKVKTIKLENDFSISIHAAERYLERILDRIEFTQEELGLARQIIRKALANRTHRVRSYFADGTYKIVVHEMVVFYDSKKKDVITLVKNKHFKHKELI